VELAMSDISPFKEGARVAIYIGDRYSVNGYRTDCVEKVHKSGRFTLKSDPKQQWRPIKPYSIRNYWTADQTGDHGWSGGGSLRIWDDASHAEITTAIDTYNRYHKFRKLCQQLSVQRFSNLVTDEVLDQLQIVVLAITPIPELK
jgi:hypothetical protein